MKLAQDTAKICKEEILNHSAKAIQDMAQRKLTSEFKSIFIREIAVTNY
ncbi:hypothetical protein EfmAA290_14940 [Enterococcus faecium]|nr:hypothetical protein EfmAA290_14940 [Enterococcus faecium]